MKRFVNRDLVVCLLLSAAILAVYLQVRNHEFIRWDDTIYVTENRHITSGLTSEGITWSFGFSESPYWHPLTWLSHMLDSEFFGLRPGMHHLSNLLLHMVNSLLLLLVLKRMTGSLWKSSFVAGLFALHPLNVESVVWVAERKNVLSTFFWMLTMFSYVHYSEQPGLSRYLLTLVLFGLGLMAKPMLVTLPFVLLLLDYWPLGRFRFGQFGADSNGKSARPIIPASRLVLEKVPLLVLSALSIYMTSVAVQRSGIEISTASVPMKLRIANALVSYVSYIAKMFWPQNLAAFYPYPSMLPIWQTLGAGFLLVCISVLIFLAWRKIPYLATGWLWFLGTLIPVIGLKQAGRWPAMADRFSYVTLIGLFIIIAWGVPELVKKVPRREVVLAAGALVFLAALMICTWRQAKLWQNSITLFEHTLSVTTNNSSIHNNLGNALKDLGKVDEAMHHYSKALEIRPRYARAHDNLGIALALKGRLGEAMTYHSQAIRLNPGYVRAHYNLGVTLVRQQKFDEAIAYFLKALELDPDYGDAHTGLGSVLVLQGRLDEATGHYSKALEIRPDHAETHYNLGVLLARQGKSEEAIIHFSRAVKTKPTYAKAHMTLGTVLAAEGRLNESAPHFVEVIRLKPNDAEAHNRLGVVLARQGKLEEAIVHFSQAVKIKPSHTKARQNLQKALLLVNKSPE